jgi:hypothetical protein
LPSARLFEVEVLDIAYGPGAGRIAFAAHCCTGGNGASVYFSDGGRVAHYNTSGCGGGLLVGPNTSCGFAENVRSAFFARGAGWISVVSPVTARSYDMYCTESSPHVCTGGNNAAVYFP